MHIVRRLILDRLGEEYQKRLAQLWEKAMPARSPARPGRHKRRDALGRILVLSKGVKRWI
jgi:hypothetical protein